MAQNGFFKTMLVLLLVIFIESGGASETALYHTPKEEVGKMYDLLGKTLPLLEEAHITHFAMCGTILGAIRHGSIIPWDDDLDFGVLEEDVDKLLALEGAFLERGLTLYKFGGGYKIFLIDGQPIFKPDGAIYPWKFPFLDLFIMKEEEGKIVHSLDRLKKAFIHEWFLEKDVKAGLKKLPFGPLTIPVPGRWIPYLNRSYPNWNVIAYKDYDHMNEQKMEKVPVLLVEFAEAEYVMP